LSLVPGSNSPKSDLVRPLKADSLRTRGSTYRLSPGRFANPIIISRSSLSGLGQGLIHLTSVGGKTTIGALGLGSSLSASDSLILIVDDCLEDSEWVRKQPRKICVSNPCYVVTSGKEALAYIDGQAEYADRRRYPFPKILLLD
jgi:hypothetical protein